MNCLSYRLRRIITVLLVFNLCLGPLAAATSAKVELYASSRSTMVPQGPTDFIRRISLRTNDLVYSSTLNKLFASVPSSVGAGGNSITSIDPTNGAVGTPVFVGSEPNRLALSDDGHSMYVNLDGAFAIRRFDASTQTAGLQFSVGQDPSFGRFGVTSLAVAPGNPNLLAIARNHPGVSPPQAGVAVYDNGVQRPTTGPGHTQGSDFIAFSASESKLYGTGGFSGLKTLTIDASGVSVFSSNLASGARIKFQNNLIFTSAGQVINPDLNTLLGTFTGSNSIAFVPDTNSRTSLLCVSRSAIEHKPYSKSIQYRHISSCRLSHHTGR